MKAFVADHAAPSGVRQRDVPEPTAGPQRAVVAVHAASLNRGEVLHLQRYRLLADGTIPGWDVAGVVAAAATDGVGPAVGTSVFGWCEQRGTWAERVAIGVDQLAAAPEGLGMDEASTLGVAGLTALAALGHAPRPLIGSRVVVTGATGGVGAFAVQLALLAGARTTAILRDGSGPADVADLLPATAEIELGLDPGADPADLIVESVGGDMLSAALQRVARGGTVVTLGRTTEAVTVVPPGWFHKHAQLHGLTFSFDYAAPGSTPAALGRLADLVVAGRLRTNISLVAEPDDLEGVMAQLLDRKIRGKVVVRWA